MGRGTGDSCAAPVHLILEHFETVGRPADDPEFCRDCLARAQEEVLAMQHSQEEVARQVVSVDEAKAAYYKLRDVRRGLDGLGQSVIGLALGVLLPMFALLFSQLMPYAVAPRDWSMAIIALIKKSGASRVDLDNYRAVHLLCFVYKWYTAVLRERILPTVCDNLPDLIEVLFRKALAHRQCWLC